MSTKRDEESIILSAPSYITGIKPKRERPTIAKIRDLQESCKALREGAEERIADLRSEVVGWMQRYDSVCNDLVSERKNSRFYRRLAIGTTLAFVAAVCSAFAIAAG